MPNTANWALTYPASTEHARMWEHFQELAGDVDTGLQAMTGSVEYSDTTNRTTTSGAFTATLTPAGTCGGTFVAPRTGKVLISFSAEMSLSVANFSIANIEVRTGAVVGSGSVTLAAADSLSLRHDITQPMSHGRSKLVTGLTAGSTYNVQMLQRVNGVTLTIGSRLISVTPAW